MHTPTKPSKDDWEAMNPAEKERELERQRVSRLDCEVCGGPRRMPSGFELGSLFGAVEIAREGLREPEADLGAFILKNTPVDGAQTAEWKETLNRLIHAARILGEQEARAQCVGMDTKTGKMR